MKSIVIYYSYSGNTKKVADILSALLTQRGEAEIIELVSPQESKSFFLQAQRAFLHQRAQIQPVNFDLTTYDLICLGTPVWAFAPAPAMNTYLDKCFGLEDKDLVLFTTYGSGTGNQRCLNYMREILAKKGAKTFRHFSLQQSKVGDNDFVKKILAQAQIG